VKAGNTQTLATEVSNPAATIPEMGAINFLAASAIRRKSGLRRDQNSASSDAAVGIRQE
jgi:hypothetical protein